MDYRPEIFIPEDQIQQRVNELGQKITRDYANEELIVICVLKGAFVFCSDLIKKIGRPLQLEFMQVSSYGDETQSSGECKMLLDLSISIRDKHVLLIEDIVDTGLTIKYLMSLLQARQPKSLKLASLLFKPARNKHVVTIDYLGMEIEDKFVVGYGLDYAGRYRELPYIGVLNSGQ